ncbi:MAG: copper chaperone PCu(A)C [Gracilimonas sp.]|nr:copper chaperone PCu(A)C [Gracilimonas sp.]
MKTIGIFFFSCLLLFNGCSDTEQQVPAEYTDKVRPAAEGGTTAAYFTVENEYSESDTIISIGSDVSSTTQMHETYKTNDGMMGMREQKQIAVPPAGSIKFQQGGLHVMLIDLQQELAIGDTVTLEIQWISGKTKQKTLPVYP